MMMCLGYFVFMTQTASYDELQRKTAWRHAEQQRIGQRPAYQFLGPDADTITLQGRLLPEVTGGRMTLDTLRAMAEGGDAWPLIEGTGRLYGFWAITSVDETDSYFLKDGLPQKVGFSLALTRVDERALDMMGALSNAGLEAATGLLAAGGSAIRGAL